MRDPRATRGREQEFLVDDRRGGQIAGHGQRDQRGVELAGAELRRVRRPVRSSRRIELELRIAPLAYGGQQRRQPIRGDRRDDAEPQRPDERLGALARGIADGIDRHQRGTRARDDVLAGGRDEHGAAIALERLNAEQVLGESAICADSAGCEIPRLVAARRKLRWSATATSASS